RLSPGRHRPAAGNVRADLSATRGCAVGARSPEPAGQRKKTYWQFANCLSNVKERGRVRPMDDAVNRERITAAEALIRPHIRRTPVVEVAGADWGVAADRIILKLELLQCSGSFKARGAFANLLMRRVEGPGVAAASGGNHGVATAYAAQKLGIAAKIFLPSVSSPAKMQRIRDSGAEL